MSGNQALMAAAQAKEDEFYTQLSDIEAEAYYYRDQFRDKVVLCNCDDPYESNFFKYFAMNFNALGLKKLIATSYQGSPITGTQLAMEEVAGLKNEPPPREPYKVEITEVPDLNDDGAIDLTDVEYLLRNDANTMSLLEGDGDFRSNECVELLKESDIVVSNPPFSLWREFVGQILDHGKQFLILGRQSSVTYKEIFPLLKDGVIWLGHRSGDMSFRVPDSYEPRETRYWVDEDGQKWRSMGNMCWYTNLDAPRRHQTLTLYKRYTPEDYPAFDHYNAINVSAVAEIPFDYSGAMAVPITFLNKHNPEQFEILNANDLRRSEDVPVKKHGLIKDKDGAIDGKPTFVRIVVRNLAPEAPKRR